MFYQRFSFRLFVQLLLINLSLFALGWLILNTRYWITISGFAILSTLLIFRLIWYINQINKDISRFITAVKTRDHTLNFQQKQTKGSFPQLYEHFDEILSAHRTIQLEQEGIHHLLRTILEQISTGIIVVRSQKETELQKQEIVFFNPAAVNLLKVPAYRYWHRLKQHLPGFDEAIENLPDGGKQF